MTGGIPSALMPVEQALEALLKMAEGALIHDVESVPLDKAGARVLAEPLVATLDLPPWPNSAMDGYALRHEDLRGEPLKVSQKIFAGAEPAPLESGTCARIFTGAPMPENADSVEMQEHVEILAMVAYGFSSL